MKNEERGFGDFEGKTKDEINDMIGDWEKIHDYKINSKVSKETISFSPILDNKKKPKSKIIDFDMDYENIIKPMARYNEIINVDKNKEDE